MIARILVFFLFVLPGIANACSCLNYINFCENLTESSNVLGVRVAATYSGIINGNFVDVELVDEIFGEAPSVQMTFYLGIGTSCDPFLSEFVVGDTIIVNASNFINYLPDWSGYSIASGCTQLYVIPSNGGDGYGYQEFVDDIDECVKETQEFGLDLIKNNTHILPNPSFYDLNIISNFPIDMSVKIYASNGSLVTFFDFNKNMEDPIDVSSWPQGLYFIRFETLAGSFAKKFVKG